MSAPTRWQFGPLGALRGVAEGLLVGLTVLAGSAVSGSPLAEAWPLAAVASAVGAVVFAAARGTGGMLAGAAAGGIAGLLVGGAIGQRNPVDRAYVQTAPGRPGPVLQITGPLLDGKEFDVRSLRGKVVLVDFWATWCGPCVGELPNVKEVYDRYHDKGLEVVGVSLDNSREQLQRFVQRKQVPWPQIFFADESQQGWNNPLARRYGIEGIPATFLLDRAGRVAAQNVRGPTLAPAVEHLLAAKEPAETTDEKAAPADEKPFEVKLRTMTVPLAQLVAALIGCGLGAMLGATAQKNLGNQPIPPAEGPAPMPPA